MTHYCFQTIEIFQQNITDNEKYIPYEFENILITPWTESSLPGAIKLRGFTMRNDDLYKYSSMKNDLTI